MILPLTACAGGSNDGDSKDSTADEDTQQASGAGSDSDMERDVAPATGSVLPDLDSIPMLEEDGTVTNPEGCPAREPFGICDGTVTACVYEESACACWLGLWQCLDTATDEATDPATNPSATDEVSEPAASPSGESSPTADAAEADAGAAAAGSVDPDPDAGVNTSDDGPATDGG
jgi:hypothetical protein